MSHLCAVHLCAVLYGQQVLDAGDWSSQLTPCCCRRTDGTSSSRRSSCTGRPSRRTVPEPLQRPRRCPRMGGHLRRQQQQRRQQPRRPAPRRPTRPLPWPLARPCQQWRRQRRQQARWLPPQQTAALQRILARQQKTPHQQLMLDALRVVLGRLACWLYTSVQDLPAATQQSCAKAQGSPLYP